MRTLSLVILFIIPPVVSFAQEFRFPSSPIGSAASAYFSSFNSGDTVRMKEFYKVYMDPRGSATERIAMDVQMRGRMGTMRPFRILRSEGDELELLVQSELRGTFRLGMRFSGGDAPKLLGIRVEQADPDEMPSERASDMQQFVAKLGDELADRAGEDLFSGVVYVAKDGTPVFERAYGYADREKNMPNTMGTLFNLGSINKAFTSLAIHNLASRGVLTYDGVVGTYLPDYPNAEVREKVTIQQLLEMSSGIGDFFGPRYEATPKEDLRSIRDYLPLFAEQPLLFEPGTGRRYSNGGYLLLGHLIEALTGEDYYDHIKRTIFAPAGMSTADWYERDTDEATIAKGYTRDEASGTWVRNLATLPQRGSSAGGGYATVQDLLRFADALENGTLGTPDYEFVDGFGIAGGAPGINAAFEWNPDDRITIVVLSNFSPPTAMDVSRFIRNILPK